MVVKGAYEYVFMFQLYNSPLNRFYFVRFLKGCDGVIAVNAHCWEQSAIDAMKFWYADWNKKVYAIGPLLPASLGLLEQSTRGSDDIKEFLDGMIAKKGQKSVVLVRSVHRRRFIEFNFVNLPKISFGTTFWPSDPTYLEEVIEAMIEKEFPFVRYSS